MTFWFMLSSQRCCSMCDSDIPAQSKDLGPHSHYPSEHKTNIPSYWLTKSSGLQPLTFFFFFLCTSLVTLVFQCLFLSFLTAHWWMFPLYITSQCLCKALLLIPCCFNLLGRRSRSTLCQGSQWVMRRRQRLRCNDVLLLMRPFYPCLFVRAHTLMTCLFTTVQLLIRAGRLNRWQCKWTTECTRND